MATLAEFQSAYDHYRLANLLGIHETELLEGLYGKKSKCKTFLLKKKSGGHRQIVSPRRVRRLVQSALKFVLDDVYRPPKSVRGFVVGESVVSNALPHVGRRTVVNVDLKNFFESISFYRVRGLLLARPFAFPWVAANVVAQACTYQGRLMAGGITSPVLSNLLAVSLDKRLGRLAGRYGATYTRYADDITFSFSQPVSRLQEFVQVNESGHYVIAPHLATEISSEGFEINLEKFRVAVGVSRKVVTGLVINQKVNVQRKWLRALDSKIYAVEKFGLDRPASDAFPGEEIQTARIRFLRHLHGKAAYLSMVRGKTDWVAAGMAARVNALSNDSRLKIPDVELIAKRDRARLGLWVVAGAHGDDLFDPPNGNGTGFTFVKGYIVSAYHVVFDEDDRQFANICVRREQEPAILLPCRVVASCRVRDVAVLELENGDHAHTRIRFNRGEVPQAGGDLWTIGYPQYFPGHTAVLQPHYVGGRVFAGGVEKVRLVGGAIMGGLSGAPAFDSEMRVFGVVHKGIANGGNADELIHIRHVADLISGI